MDFGVDNCQMTPSIRAGDYDMKVSSVLTKVCRGFCGYIGDPKSALDVGEAGRIRASIGGVQSWVSLKVDIESCARINSVTALRTFGSIICFQSVKA